MSENHPLQHYFYDIPDANIGRIPAEPRDHARLFVYHTETDHITHDYFYNLSNYLPENALMVMNNTGVIPARVVFTKDTGGKVGGLILFNEGIQADGSIPIIVMKQIIVGRKLYIEDYEFVITRHEEQYFYILPQFDPSLLAALLVKHGTTPTPRYLGKLHMAEEHIRERYQTIYAEDKKSVAAPTASLHFTEQVFESLKHKNITRTEVTLHVGMGTFAEISQKNIDTDSLHTEPISISSSSANAIRHAKKNKKPIIAVGTTAVRTLESQADLILDPHNNDDIQTSTNIFIHPPFSFQLVDGMMTNFHVPRSSLMALVDAFLIHKQAQRTIIELYHIAIENEYRFFSFGDSMLIL